MKKVISILAACMLVFSFAGMASADVCLTCETDPGYIDRGCEEAPEQGSCYTSPFDYEDFGECSEGLGSYCETGGKGELHRALFQICECIPDPFITVDDGMTFDVGMKVYVDKHDGNGPVYGNNGVYWAEDVNAAGIPVETFATQGAACDEEACTPDNAFVGEFDYALANGDTVARTPYTGSDCDVPELQEITEIRPAMGQADGTHGYTVTPDDAIDNNSVWWIDIPRMRADSGIVERGWDVYVEVCIYETLDTGGVCGQCEGCCCLIKIGTLCCESQVVEPDPCKDTLIFPYFAKSDGAWWNGMAVTNMDSEAGDATATLYENDGDVFTATVTVPGNTTQIVPFADLTGTGTLGDTQGYVKVEAGFSASGFGMMGKPTTGESMGYIAEKLECGNTCTCFK